MQDAALLLDSDILFEGLKRGLWRETPVRDVLLSSLAAGMTPDYVAHGVASQLISSEEKLLAYAVSVDPKLKPKKRGESSKQSPASPFLPDFAAVLPPTALRLSRATCFLYMVSSSLLQAVADSNDTANTFQ
jgi:hypothetical protein